VAPSFHRAEALALNALNAGERRVAIGLHVTLTAPFRPLSEGYQPTRDSAFHSIKDTLIRACLRRLNANSLRADVASQIRALPEGFPRAPDFIDGHQPVHLFPQARDAVLTVAKRDAPDAWVRQCGRASPLAYSTDDRKGLLLDVLSRGFRRRAAALGVRT